MTRSTLILGLIAAVAVSGTANAGFILSGAQPGTWAPADGHAEISMSDLRIVTVNETALAETTTLRDIAPTTIESLAEADSHLMNTRSLDTMMSGDRIPRVPVADLIGPGSTFEHTATTLVGAAVAP